MARQPAVTDAEPAVTGTEPASSFRRTQQERRATTERRILEAAVQLIAESGSSAVSLADVGVAAGYSRGIVTQAFGSREEMLRRVAVYAQQTFVFASSEPPGLDPLLAAVDAYVEHLMRSTPAIRAFLLMWGEAAATTSPLGPIFAERDASFAEFFRGHIAAGIAAGSVRANVDPDAAAIAVLGLLRGTGLQLMHAPGHSSRSLRDQAVDLTRHALQAPAPPKGRRKRPAATTSG